MKQASIWSIVLIWLGMLGFAFAADRSYWAGTDIEHPGWRLPAPTANGPLWGGANGREAGRMFETRQQLLFAINTWTKYSHQPELTMDDLIVRIASCGYFEEHQTRLDELLRDVVKNERFKLPVELWVERSSEIILSKQNAVNERLPLPAHYVLSIRLRNLPWGSKDHEGISPKIVSWDVPIAYAFGGGGTKNRKMNFSRSEFGNERNLARP